jgi:MFS transporter, Spinster family, sphingosine-1-phosphate transporter
VESVEGVNTEESWGKILARFKWMYAFMSPIGGYVADRFSRRFVICVSLFVWSAVTWATGQVTTYDELLWTRTLMGISEAFYFPAALALIADYHFERTRSRAVGLHQAGMYCGVILGGFGGHVADAPDLGWRWAFDVAGIVGVAYALPLVLLLRDAPRREAESKPGPGAAVRALATNGSFVLLVLYFALPSFAGWVVRDWMPAILKERFSLGQGTAGVSATLYWTVAAFFAAYGGGVLADRAMRYTPRGRVYVSAAGMALLVPALAGVGHAPTHLVAVLFLVLFGIGWGVSDCNNMPILAQIVRPNLRATGYGLMNLFGFICGGFADWGFGALRDQKVPLDVIFGVLAGLGVVSIVLVLLIRPKPELIDRSNVTPV